MAGNTGFVVYSVCPNALHFAKPETLGDIFLLKRKDEYYGNSSKNQRR